MTSTQSTDAAVRGWLLLVFTWIVAMVALGGITRLTGSGLSMVEWHPLMGFLPPLDEASWDIVFAQYQEFPQYRLVNHWMTVEDFKQIYIWEYLHRLCGRLLGVVFLVPWVVFVVRGQIRRTLALRTGGAFLLGGLQGLLGWYMVKSGLVDTPDVSHFRLAAHLSLAFVTALYVLWIWMSLQWPESGKRQTNAGRVWVAIGVLIGLQVVYGAFMAGLKAGYLSNTFPLMSGSIFPVGLFKGKSVIEVAVWAPAGVHLIHRTLGWCVLVATIFGALWARALATSRRQRRLSELAVVGVSIQFALGVLTILFSVPVCAAVTHQVGALLLLSVVTACVYSFREPDCCVERPSASPVAQQSTIN